MTRNGTGKPRKRPAAPRSPAQAEREARDAAKAATGRWSAVRLTFLAQMVGQGMSQAAIAKALGVSQQMVSKLVRKLPKENP